MIVTGHRGSWPEWDERLKRWILVTVSVCEERKGVYCVKVCRGYKIEEEFLEINQVQDYVSSLIPIDATDIWSRYIEVCASTGIDTLGVLPPPPHKTINPFLVELIRISDSIYLANKNYPPSVHHHMLSIQTPKGMQVDNEWGGLFVNGENSISTTIYVIIPPSIDDCRKWYRTLLPQKRNRFNSRALTPQKNMCISPATAY